MATTVIEEKETPTAALARRVSPRSRLVALLAILAVAASFSAQPFAAVAVGAAVLLASEIGHRVR